MAPRGTSSVTSQGPRKSSRSPPFPASTGRAPNVSGARGTITSVPTPDPNAIRPFRSVKAFEAWLAANHAKKTELYLRIYKKDSGRPTVTYAEALDVALCWGWID